MSDTASRWYVVQTHVHSEMRAAGHLQRQGFATYLPVFRKRRRHARRVDIVSAPLFPRYLFASIDMSTQPWRSIFSTVGVSRLVCHGDTPTALSDQAVATLKAREDADGFVLLEPPPRFRPGDKIKILDGVFAECLGLYDGMPDRDRVAILLDLLGRKVRVLVDADSVTAA